MPPFPSEVEFGAVLQYAVRGQSPLSRRSRDVPTAIKTNGVLGRVSVIGRAALRARENIEAGGCLSDQGRLVMACNGDLRGAARLRNRWLGLALPEPRALVLVDDIVTRGSSFVGVLPHLTETFPGTRIDCFALLRTVSQGEIASILDPVAGRITYRHGHLHRDP